MLTVLEVGHVDDDRVRELSACPDAELRRVLVRPGGATWTEAHGRELVVEHVAAAPWLAWATGAALRDLVQLHRPAAIVCGWPEVSAIAARLASGRLVPRPALIARVRTDSTWWEAPMLAGFDAVFVHERGLARRLWGLGVDRIFHVPRSEASRSGRADTADVGEGSKVALARETLCVREVVDHVRAGRRVPSGIHERMQPAQITTQITS